MGVATVCGVGHEEGNEVYGSKGQKEGKSKKIRYKKEGEGLKQLMAQVY